MANAKAPTSSNDDPGTEVEIPSVDSKLNDLDDDLNPIEGKDDPFEKKDDKETEDDHPDDITDDEEGEEDTEEESDGESEDDSESEEDNPEDDTEGYSIDEGVEEDQEPSTPEEVAPEDKYILDNIKDDAITVRGTIGESKEVKEYKVLAPQQLPKGFKFVDDQEATIAIQGFQQIETKAGQLQSQYRQDQTNKSTQEFIEREKKADRSDIAALQKSGDIPMFQVEPSDANFEKDRGVALVQEVLDYKEKINAQYNEAYQNGDAYRHIGFREAYKQFKEENPQKFNRRQEKEDRDRKEFAKRTSRPQSARSTVPKAKVHSGMSPRDLDMFIENLDI